MNTLWGTKIKIKTKSMKKTWLGWKGYRTDLSAAAYGDFAYGQDGSCGDNTWHFYEDINRKDGTNKKKAKYVKGFDDAYKLYVQDNKLEGIHTVYSQRETQDVY